MASGTLPLNLFGVVRERANSAGCTGFWTSEIFGGLNQSLGEWEMKKSSFD